MLQPDISIVQELRLPCFDRAPGMPLMAYPLPQPNFTVEFVNSIPPDTFDWRNWHEEIERRNGRLRAENARIIARPEKQPAREEREAAEANEANQVAVGIRRSPMDIPRDPRRAGLPYSRVTLFNSSEVQTHVVFDRQSQPHTLQPGQRKRDVEMTHEDIANFQRERSPDRFYPGTTTLKPLHPIIIEDVPSMVQAGGHYE